jgi:hypothetical protein
VGDNGFIYGLKCKMCTKIEHKEKLVIPKIGSLCPNIQVKGKGCHSWCDNWKMVVYKG